MVFLDNAVDISLTGTGWITNVDLSSYIPASAKGVFLQFSAQGGEYKGTARKAGSTDDFSADSYVGGVSGGTYGMLCGVDANRKIDIYRNNAGVHVYLRGWFDSEVFFDNWDLIFTGAGGDFTDVDLSAKVPSGATVAILFIKNSYTSDRDYAVRAKGSSDNRKTRELESNACCGEIVKLDANRVFQAYGQSANITIYLVGYVPASPSGTEKIVCPVNRTLITDAGTAWTDRDANSFGVPEGSKGIFIEQENPKSYSSYQDMCRKKTSSDDWYTYSKIKGYGHPISGCALDGDGYFQHRQSNASMNNYTAGWMESVAAPPPEGWMKLQYVTEPPTGGAFNKLKYASEPPVSGAWNKVLYEGE